MGFKTLLDKRKHGQEILVYSGLAPVKGADGSRASKWKGSLPLGPVG